LWPVGIGMVEVDWERYVEYYAMRRDVRACIFRLSTTYARQTTGNEYGFVTHYVESVKHGWPVHLPMGGHPIRDILHVTTFLERARHLSVRLAPTAFTISAAAGVIPQACVR